MKKSKLLVGLILIISMCFFLFTGCGWFKSEEEIHEGAVKKLEKIYDEDFTLVDSKIGSAGDVFGKGSNMELVLKCDKYSDKIRMRYTYDRFSGKYNLVGSNFNYVRYKNKILNKLQFINQIYPNCKIYLRCWNLDHDKDYSFEEYISSINTLELYVFLPPSANKESKASDAEKVRQKIESNGIYVTQYDVFYTKEQSQYNSIDVDNFDETIFGKLRNQGCMEGTFWLDMDYNWTHEEWSRE